MDNSDPFIKMAEANKTYGFTIAVKELKETVPNIFRYASAYKRNNNLTSKGLWEMFIEDPPDPEETQGEEKSDAEDPLPAEILQTQPGDKGIPDVDPEAMEGEKYNMCHFWSNFEIARLDWFRSKEYEAFFEMMDKSGGFWMERVPAGLSQMVYCWKLTFCTSGAMLPSILLQLAPSCHQVTYTISEISDIDTLRSSIVRPMPLLASETGNLSSK